MVIARLSRTALFFICLPALTVCLWGQTKAQHTDDRPWMNAALPAEQRAELALRQMTLSEKIALLHGNGMAHAAQWQMPLTSQSNGGAGMVEGVERLGIPRIYMSDAAYGVRSSGENGRYSTALPSNLGAASSWDPSGACEYGALIGRELRAQGYNMTLGGGTNLTRDPRNGRTFEYLGEDPLLAGTLDGNLMRCEQAEWNARPFLYQLGTIKLEWRGSFDGTRQEAYGRADSEPVAAG